jgi:hypothetical protein
MNKAERRLERAARMTPAADRARYVSEWRSALAAAANAGLSEDQVSRSAQKMAFRLRSRQVERVFLGQRGAVAMGLAWAAVLVVLVAAFLLGNVLLLLAVLMLGMLALVFARAGAPSRWSHWLMVTSILTGAASAAFVWWVAGVTIDAADSMTREPPAAAWGGFALVMLGLSAVAFIASVVGAVVREPSRPPE